MTIKIGITERNDPGIDFSWYNKRKNYDGLILITKKLSDEFIEKAMNSNCIVHATITGWGNTIIEPNVPDLDYSYYYFNDLIECIGEDRLVLRIDPIIPTEEGVKRALGVYSRIYIENGNETRVRISFLDNYPHVRKRFIEAGLEPLKYGFHESLENRKYIYSLFNNPNIEVCGEPGFNSIGCVSEKDLKILGLEIPKDFRKAFQRPECNCLNIKHEIFAERKQCPNKCLYCYWK